MIRGFSKDEENYLQKFDQINKKNLIRNYHPELVTHNNDEVETLCQIVRNEHGVIVDPLHKTVPFLTKYERARILGERAKQLNMGAKPLIELGPEVIDGYLIALKEFEEKKKIFHDYKSYEKFFQKEGITIDQNKRKKIKR